MLSLHDNILLLFNTNCWWVRIWSEKNGSLYSNCLIKGTSMYLIIFCRTRWVGPNIHILCIEMQYVFWCNFFLRSDNMCKGKKYQLYQPPSSFIFFVFVSPSDKVSGYCEYSRAAVILFATCTTSYIRFDIRTTILLWS